MNTAGIKFNVWLEFDSILALLVFITTIIIISKMSYVSVVLYSFATCCYTVDEPNIS